MAIFMIEMLKSSEHIKKYYKFYALLKLWTVSEHLNSRGSSFHICSFGPAEKKKAQSPYVLVLVLHTKMYRKCTENVTMCMVRTSVTHLPAACVPLFYSYHILTSPVIYYWTDTRPNGIYLLSGRSTYVRLTYRLSVDQVSIEYRVDWVEATCIQQPCDG